MKLILQKQKLEAYGLFIIIDSFSSSLTILLQILTSFLSFSLYNSVVSFLLHIAIE